MDLPNLVRGNLRRLFPNAPEMFMHQTQGSEVWLYGDKGTIKKLGDIPIHPKTGQLVKFFTDYDARYKGRRVRVTLTPGLEWMRRTASQRLSPVSISDLTFL